jgi:hypothetical protein
LSSTTCSRRWWYALGDLLEEVAELSLAVLLAALIGHLAGGDLERNGKLVVPFRL